MFDRIKYKKFARLQLKGRWTVPVLVMLLYEVIIILLKLPQYKNIFIALGNPGTFAETYSALAAADSSANAVGLSALTIVAQRVCFSSRTNICVHQNVAESRSSLFFGFC